MEERMSMSNLKELFVHDLKDMYYAEQTVVDVLSTLADQTESGPVAEEFTAHRKETEGHLGRLDQVFERLDIEPEGVKCEGINGLVTEHESFVAEDPDKHILDIHNLTVAQKIEHYEIAPYENLALFATRLGMPDAGDLVHENLEEEKATLHNLSVLTDDVEYEDVLDSVAV